ncbi:MAG: 16S rRNA (adenine(1518)-N(6)/adenine(1519)-N(6))-dimethyltransferase RsmA [Candidatus Aminicenantia bacterium]
MNKKKYLGQHFLKNPFVIRKIIYYINPQPSDLIIEIGAGKGAITFPLTQKAGKVIAIEKDKKLIPYLKKRETPNLEIVENDVLKINFNSLIPKNKKVKVVGNLPYSISAPLLFKIYSHKDLISECLFLLQKEVAERICASPHSKQYAPLSVFFQLYFSANIVFYVSGKSFSPPPKVDSAFIILRKRNKPLVQIKDELSFLNFLKGIFSQRRKTLINNLKNLTYSPGIINTAFKKFNLNPYARAEELTIKQFSDLFKWLSSAKN